MNARSLSEITGLSLPEQASIKKFLVSCTVPLVYRAKERAGVLGTGAFFATESRSFFITAAHLFPGADPNMMGVPERGGEDGAVSGFGHATIHHPRNTDDHDVAVIELEDSEFIQRAKSGWTFLDASNVAADDFQSENYLIAGYPDATVRYKDGVLTPSALMQLYTGPYKDDVVGGRGEFDFFLRYGEEAGNVYGFTKETPHLGGASGALVFGLAERPVGIWSPQAVLKIVGVQVAFVHAKYVRAKRWTLLQHVLGIVLSHRNSGA